MKPITALAIFHLYTAAKSSGFDALHGIMFFLLIREFLNRIERE